MKTRNEILFEQRPFIRDAVLFLYFKKNYQILRKNHVKKADERLIFLFFHFILSFSGYIKTITIQEVVKLKAVTFQGMKEMEVKEVPDAVLQKKDDIIVKITSTAICGSDLHIYQGALPAEKDYVVGHEPMGIVEEVGPEVTKVKKGDRVVIPFNISCGSCFYCKHDLESQCDNSNSNPEIDTGGYFGFTERYGNHPGGQAEYLRVPFGNFMPFVIPEPVELEDEALLFMSDVLPTAYWSIENANVKSDDTVVVLGCGPVGLMAQKFAWMKGAKRVIAVDNLPYSGQKE